MKGESEVVLSRGDDDRRVLPGQIAGRSSVVREASSPGESRGSNCGARVILVLGAKIPSPPPYMPPIFRLRAFSPPPILPRCRPRRRRRRRRRAKQRLWLGRRRERLRRRRRSSPAAAITARQWHPFPLVAAMARRRQRLPPWPDSAQQSRLPPRPDLARRRRLPPWLDSARQRHLPPWLHLERLIRPRSIADYAGKINCLDFHRKEDLLVTSSEDDSIRLYNITSATDLGNLNLSGHLVPELGKLEHLQYLGDKAFCSSECRYQEILFDEAVDNLR